MLKRDISINSDLLELERLTAFLEETAEEWGIENDLLFYLNLVAEEVVSNIILYGFEDNRTGEKILLELSVVQGELKICITDHGIEFDPLKVPPPDDLDKPLSERKIGGLGVYFIRQMMDKVEYRRENDSNILVLTKKI
jgi:anti-sigma regulatory factor (Ser/Thr protein kinase)